MRSILSAADSTDIPLLPDHCLNAVVAPQGSEHFIQIACHLNPSAEELFVLSRDERLVGALYGWTVAILPNDFIVYHNSQIHFAPTHALGISVFDPATGSDKKIYPPMPYQPVRTAFMARVAQAYKARGRLVSRAQSFRRSGIL